MKNDLCLDRRMTLSLQLTDHTSLGLHSQETSTMPGGPHTPIQVAHSFDDGLKMTSFIHETFSAPILSLEWPEEYSENATVSAPPELISSAGDEMDQITSHAPIGFQKRSIAERFLDIQRWVHAMVMK
jgi:hypothetical protein